MNADENIAYVHEHFLPLPIVAECAGTSTGTIAALVTQQLLPRPAYFRGQNGQLASNLGSVPVEIAADYFHPSAIPQARHANALLAAGIAPETLAERIKAAFLSEYLQHIRWLQHAGLIERDVWEARLASEHARFALGETEFQHWIAGTYGVCTRNNSASAIAIKECMTANIDALTNAAEHGILMRDELARLARYLHLFDRTAALFAPFERATSSRQRLCVDVAKRYGIDLSPEEEDRDAGRQHSA